MYIVPGPGSPAILKRAADIGVDVGVAAAGYVTTAKTIRRRRPPTLTKIAAR